MVPSGFTSIIEQTFNFFKDGTEYAVDAWQRSFLFTDILRKRGNNYLEHNRKGNPPVLVFDYEIILDGRTFDQPVNYALAAILDRRKCESTKSSTKTDIKEKKSYGINEEAKDRNKRKKNTEKIVSFSKRPIVIIDPRAGHGPGIGGSKLDSQIGVALNSCHPVYFILFFSDPEPGQTLADVLEAEIRFLEEVVKRHPKTDKPAVIGNCQAGWAAALIGAVRPDIVGPLIFNGSPLSYWGGVEGTNPMRYKGGLLGGVWANDLLCDIGNGRFDGAHLVAGFEDLNPANTKWSKLYNVYANVDTEEERFLTFEKWWGGFYKMNKKEIHFIVDSLFVGNELEAGFLELQEGKIINLKNFKDPIVVFASSGDNITPPQQALNWISKVYGTNDEIKRCGQVIVYMVHEKIGHLGIFVSGSIAEREHKEIISSVEMLEYLAPGLYEMVIVDEPGDASPLEYIVSFEEREIEDILSFDDGLEDETAFQGVSTVSRFNDNIYQTFVSPWVRSATTEFSAEFIRQLHPLRSERYVFCDLNPCLVPVQIYMPYIKRFRHTVASENIFSKAEKTTSALIVNMFNLYRDRRDSMQELAFKTLYGNSWIETFFSKEPDSDAIREETVHKCDDLIRKKLWEDVMKEGGFKEAVTRIILAIMQSNQVLDRRQYDVAEKIILANDRLRNIHPNDLKILVKQQAAILEKDEDMAIETLSLLLPEEADRIEAFEIANSIAVADLELDKAEEAILNKMKKQLNINLNIA